MVYQYGIDSKAMEFQYNRQNPVELITTETDDVKEDDQSNQDDDDDDDDDDD